MKFKKLEDQMATMYPSKEATMGRVLNALVGLYGLNPKHVNESVVIDMVDHYVLYNGKRIGWFRWVDETFPVVRFHDAHFINTYAKSQVWIQENGEITVNLIPILHPFSGKAGVYIGIAHTATALVRWLDEQVLAGNKGARLFRKHGFTYEHSTKAGGGKVTWVRLAFTKTTGVIETLDFINRNFRYTNKKQARAFYKSLKE